MEPDAQVSVSATIEQLTKTAVEVCADRGEILTQSGCLSNQHYNVSIASETGFGTINEDFVAMFRSGSPSNEIAVAIADGVGSSLLAAKAAELACCVSLQSMAKSKSFAEAKPFLSAQRIFRFIGKWINRRTGPAEGFTQSAWESAIGARQVLQTTLTVIWTEGDQVKALSLADGGVIGSSDGRNVQYASLSDRCSGIGPYQPLIQPRALAFGIQQYVSVFTDGLNELMEENASVRTAFAGATGLNASQAINKALVDFPEYIEDNVSLCQFRRIND